MYKLGDRFKYVNDESDYTGSDASFPIGQVFVVLGGVGDYIGYKKTGEYAGRGDIYLSVPNDIIHSINGLPVVAKIDKSFIFGSRSSGYYKAATVHKKQNGHYWAKQTKVKFELL